MKIKTHLERINPVYLTLLKINPFAIKLLELPNIQIIKAPKNRG